MGLIPRKQLFRSPIFRSLLYIMASRGSTLPLPDLPIVPPIAGAAAPFDARAAAALDAAPSLSPASGLMYSLSSLEPSSHAISSTRSKYAGLCTFPSTNSSSNCDTAALYSGMGTSRFNHRK